MKVYQDVILYISSPLVKFAFRILLYRNAVMRFENLDVNYRCLDTQYARNLFQREENLAKTYIFASYIPYLKLNAQVSNSSGIKSRLFINSFCLCAAENNLTVDFMTGEPLLFA